MKLHFSVFGFEILVMRPKAFSALVFMEGPDDPLVWTVKTSSYYLARFLAWKTARSYALALRNPATYLIYRTDYKRKAVKQIWCRTISVTKVISFFGK